MLQSVLYAVVGPPLVGLRETDDVGSAAMLADGGFVSDLLEECPLDRLVFACALFSK